MVMPVKAMATIMPMVKEVDNKDIIANIVYIAKEGIFPSFFRLSGVF